MVLRVGILGCGLLGQHLAQSLKANAYPQLPFGPQLEVFTTTTRAENKENIAKYSDRQFVLRGTQKKIMEEFFQPLDLLVITISAKDPTEYHKSYLLTCRNIKNLVKKNKYLGPEHIIYCSATGTYGDHLGATVTEESQLLSQTPENLSIISAEKEILKSEEFGTKVTILRLPQLYGPNNTLKSQIHRISGSTLCGKGDYYTNFTHLDDACAAIIHLFHLGLGGIFNCVSNTHLQRHHFYNLVCGHYGWPAPTWDQSQGFFPYRQNKIVSSEKLLKTKFQFKHSQVFDWIPE